MFRFYAECRGNTQKIFLPVRLEGVLEHKLHLAVALKQSYTETNQKESSGQW